jgi:hypothetical protein
MSEDSLLWLHGVHKKLKIRRQEQHLLQNCHFENLAAAAAAAAATSLIIFQEETEFVHGVQKV